MVEALALVLLWEGFPIQLGCLKEREGTHHIGASKGEWIFDGAIDMRFSCQMDDTIDVFVLHQLIERIEVANVHLHELVVGLILNVLKVSEVACISELVEIDDVLFGIFVYKEANYMTSNKACTTSDNYMSFHFVCCFKLLIHFLSESVQ